VEDEECQEKEQVGVEKKAEAESKQEVLWKVAESRRLWVEAEQKRKENRSRRGWQRNARER
jgi:hypothetical protein